MTAPTHSMFYVHSGRKLFFITAFANPKSKVFGKNALSDIGLSPLLMSRCALIVKVQNISKEERIDLFHKKFYGGGEIREKHEYYDQWTKLARTYRPEITASEKDDLEKYHQIEVVNDEGEVENLRIPVE